MATCADAVREALTEKGGVLSTNGIISLVYQKYPNKSWKESRIRAHLIGCSNHSSSKHYLSCPKFLYSVGPGKARLYNPEEDGEWIVDNRGARLKDDSEEEILGEDLIEATISFESDLGDYISRDISKLEKGLSLYDENGITGRQFNTEVGRIDLLARDKKGNLVVIELKSGKSRYTVPSQILSYIACIRKDFPEKKDAVRGIIIADGFDDILRIAVTETLYIKLVRYILSFDFKEV